MWIINWLHEKDCLKAQIEWFLTSVLFLICTAPKHLISCSVVNISRAKIESELKECGEGRNNNNNKKFLQDKWNWKVCLHQLSTFTWPLCKCSVSNWAKVRYELDRSGDADCVSVAAQPLTDLSSFCHLPPASPVFCGPLCSQRNCIKSWYKGASFAQVEIFPPSIYLSGSQFVV